jgi:hypothetical protein
MLRTLHLLVLAAITTLGIASSATTVSAETALRADRELSQPRVLGFAEQARETHQQNALGYGECTSDACLAAEGGAAVARLPVPPTPGNMPLREFGKAMNWGSGGEAARAQIANLTREGLQSSGLTAEIANAWAQFYRNEAVRVATNPSALGRAELMEAAARLLK